MNRQNSVVLHLLVAKRLIMQTFQLRTHRERQAHTGRRRLVYARKHNAKAQTDASCKYVFMRGVCTLKGQNVKHKPAHT